MKQVYLERALRMHQKTHEGNRLVTITTMAYHDESETIATSDPVPSVVPAVPDLQQEEECVLDSDRESENGCPHWDDYDSKDEETEVFNDETAWVV